MGIEIKECDQCKDTTCILNLDTELSNDSKLTVRVRYDFDCDDRNEFDIQLVEYVKDGDNFIDTNSDWSYSFNTNYCPFCGRKLNNQKDNKYLDDNYLMINHSVDWVLSYDNKPHNIEVKFTVNKLYGLFLLVFIDGELKNQTSKLIKYNPVTGEDLTIIDK